MQNQFQFKFNIGQEVTARLGNPGDQGYAKETHENARCVVLARGRHLAGERYLILPIGTNMLCNAGFAQTGMQEDLYTTSAMSFGPNAQLESMVDAAKIIGFKL